MTHPRHLHAEQHRGLVPSDQLGASPGTAGRVLIDDGTGSATWVDPPDPGSQSYLTFEQRSCQDTTGWVAQGYSVLSTGSWGVFTQTNRIEATCPAYVDAFNGLLLELDGGNTFTAGMQYVLLFAVRVPEPPTSGSFNFQIEFGVLDTSDRGYTFAVIPDSSADRWIYLSATWVPDADHDSSTVGIRFWRIDGLADNITLYLGWIDVVSVAANSLLPLYAPLGMIPSDYSHQTRYWGPYNWAVSSWLDSSAVNYYDATASVRVGTWGAGLDGYNAGVYVGPDFHETFAYHAPADLAESGMRFEIGDDGLRFWISEKDDTTIQLYPDSGSGADIELADNSGKSWIIDGGAP